MNPSSQLRYDRRSPQPSGGGGFTLIEIMIVVAVVGTLSLLAVAGVRKVRDLAIRSAIQNNLRQIFEAKEHYFFESGTGAAGSLITLKKSGHMKASTVESLMSGHTLEGKAGWHYSVFVFPGEPAFAYRGRSPLVSNPNQRGVPVYVQTGAEFIWYPAPPASLSPNTPRP